MKSKPSEQSEQSPQIDVEEIRRLARLAHLELDDEECQRFAQQVSQIVEYAQRIQRLDTERVAPTSHALLESTQLLREDQAGSDRINRDALLEAAPVNGDGLFKVPKVLP